MVVGRKGMQQDGGVELQQQRRPGGTVQGTVDTCWHMPPGGYQGLTGIEGPGGGEGGASCTIAPLR
jgi:hypothetical protein